MLSRNSTLQHMIWLLFGLTLLFILVWQAPAFYSVQGLASYLPLHMFAETFSIVVSMMVFGVAWNVYSAERPGNIVILSCALLAAGLIDFAHMLSFKGMPDFITPSDPEKAINLWLAARLIAALALLIVAVHSWQQSYKPRARYGLLAISLAVSGIVIWLGLAYPHSWPRTFIAGQGLTPFKIGAEYAIVAILLIPAVLFYRQARRPQSHDAASLFAATVITILSELTFTVYSDVADIFNLLGHLYKIVAYIFIYRAVFVTSVRDPFRRLDAEFAENRRITQELRTASLYTRSLIEASLDPLVTISVRGKITDVNHATEEFTGKSRVELVGTDFSDYFTEPEKAREGYQQVFLKGSVTDYPLALRHRDGHVTNVLYNASVYKDEAGSALGVFAAARDITERNNAQEALFKVQQMFRSLVENSPDIITRYDRDCRRTYVNPTYLKVAQIPQQELLGTAPIKRSPLPADSAVILQNLLRKVLDSGIVESVDVKWPMADNIDHWYNIYAFPEFDREGQVVSVMTVSRDITERKQAEEQLRELNSDFVTLLENTGDYIYFKDQDSRFIFCSQTLARITGHNSWRDMIGKNDLEVFPEDTARIYYEEELPIFGEGKPLLNKTDPYYDEQGKQGWVNTNKWPVFGDDKKTVIGIFGISRDITELKDAEDKITELNRDLERRVGERTEQLETAIRELEAFSYSVSHDLRTPLRAIDGFSHILLDDYADKLDEEGKRLLNVVRDNTSRMGQLIDDILKFSRAGRVEITSTEIDMEAMAHNAFMDIKSSAADDKLQLEIEHLPPARGDRAMMHQVFVNLLSNAIKFSRNKEPAVVKVGSSIKGNEAIYFVKDNGAGFDMQFAGKLFGVFQRLHSVDEFEGTGIGLAIVKRIITRHGGRVWAEGKVNEGATVYFALPRVDSPDK